MAQEKSPTSKVKYAALLGQAIQYGANCSSSDRFQTSSKRSSIDDHLLQQELGDVRQSPQAVFSHYKGESFGGSPQQFIQVKSQNNNECLEQNCSGIQMSECLSEIRRDPICFVGNISELSDAADSAPKQMSRNESLKDLGLHLKSRNLSPSQSQKLVNENKNLKMIICTMQLEHNQKLEILRAENKELKSQVESLKRQVLSERTEFEQTLAQFNSQMEEMKRQVCAEIQQKLSEKSHVQSQLSSNVPQRQQERHKLRSIDEFYGTISNKKYHRRTQSIPDSCEAYGLSFTPKTLIDSKHRQSEQLEPDCFSIEQEVEQTEVSENVSYKRQRKPSNVDKVCQQYYAKHLLTSRMR